MNQTCVSFDRGQNRSQVFSLFGHVSQVAASYPNFDDIFQIIVVALFEN